MKNDFWKPERPAIDRVDVCWGVGKLTAVSCVFKNRKIHGNPFLMLHNQPKARVYIYRKRTKHTGSLVVVDFQGEVICRISGAQPFTECVKALFHKYTCNETLRDAFKVICRKMLRMRCMYTHNPT